MKKQQQTHTTPPRKKKKDDTLLSFLLFKLKKASNTQENMIGAETDLLIQYLKYCQSTTLQQISSKDAGGTCTQLGKQTYC